MQIVFRQSISDAKMGSFMEGRVITIDPAAPDFPVFKQWLNAGVVEAVRAGSSSNPSNAPERAVAPAQSSRARGQARPSSASRRGPVS